MKTFLTGWMLCDLFGIVVVVVVVVDVLGFLHKRRQGARRVLDDVWLEFVQFRKSLEKMKDSRFLMTLIILIL